jgi:hypothetical protein
VRRGNVVGRQCGEKVKGRVFILVMMACLVVMFVNNEACTMDSVNLSKGGADKNID